MKTIVYLKYFVRDCSFGLDSKDPFLELLTRTMFESLTMFNEELYKHHDIQWVPL